MRGLFRSVLALFTLGLSVIGCGRTNSPGPDEGPDNSAYHAAFRVPGLN
jgi:hypothetical protein